MKLEELGYLKNRSTGTYVVYSLLQGKKRTIIIFDKREIQLFIREALLEMPYLTTDVPYSELAPILKEAIIEFLMIVLKEVKANG